MKTLIFITLMLVLGADLFAHAADFYDGPAWGSIAPAIRTLPSQAPAPLTTDTFRRFFRHSPLPTMRDLVKACGHPAEEWNSEATRQLDSHLPSYHGGHFFRYLLPDHSHVYIWTGEDDAAVMRADYVFNSGRVAPLYLRPL